MFMKRFLIPVLLLCTALPVSAQNRSAHSLMEDGYLSNGFYIQMGYISGPSFSSLFDYFRTAYRPVNDIKDFGGNVAMNIGYLSRFHRNFALDVGFSIYGMNKEFQVIDTAGSGSDIAIRHELNYQSAVFTGTLPVILEFSPKQPVVPYFGIGISLFSLRLDHYRGSEALRDTRTAVGGHFGGGVAYKITRKLWLDLRARWHAGSSKLLTLEDDPNTPGYNYYEFDIKQNLSQFSVGIDYFFH